MRATDAVPAGTPAPAFEAQVDSDQSVRLGAHRPPD